MARGQPQGEEVYRPEVSPEDMPRKRVPEMGESPIAQGLEHFTAAVQQKFEADTATWAGNQLTDLRLKMNNQVEEAKQNAQPGAQGFGGQILNQFTQEQKKLTDSAASNPVALRLLGPGLNTLKASFGDEAIKYEAEEG